MEHLAVISHNFFRANGFHKSRSPSSPNGPALQGSQLITLVSVTGWTRTVVRAAVVKVTVKVRLKVIVQVILVTVTLVSVTTVKVTIVL